VYNQTLLIWSRDHIRISLITKGNYKNVMVSGKA